VLNNNKNYLEIQQFNAISLHGSFVQED